MAPSSDDDAPGSRAGSGGGRRGVRNQTCTERRTPHRTPASRSHAALSHKEAMKGVCITVIAAETLSTFRLKSGDRARRLACAVLMR